MNISFDFDGCLGDIPNLQTLAKSLTSAGHRVFVLTSRNPQTWGSDVPFKLFCDKLGIEQVLYAHNKNKLDIFKEWAIDLHFDDDDYEVESINAYKPAGAVLVGYEGRVCPVCG